jgi:hypothetical protein
MARRPQRLARGVDVHGTESLLVDAALDQSADPLVDDVRLARVSVRRAPHQKRELVDVRVRDAERDVGAPCLPKQRDRIPVSRRLDQLPDAFGELVEALLDETVKQRILVLEVDVEVGMRAADPLRQLAHRDAFVAVVDECFTRGVQDGSPQLVPVALTRSGKFCLTHHDHWLEY